MALRYWVTGGSGNYDSTTNWSTSSGGASGASVPTTADDAIWDVNSGAGTVAINVASVAKSVNFTNFTGTLDFQDTLEVAGNITLGVGMSFSNTTGTPVLSVTAIGTLTSNGVIFPYDFSINPSSNITCTLADDWECLNLILAVTAAGTPSFNGNSFFVNGNLTNFTTNRYIAGTTAFVMQGTGSVTTYNTTQGWTASNLVINTSGTITLVTFSSNNYFGWGTSTFTYTSGTVVVSPGIILVTRGTADLNGLSFETIYLSTSTTFLSYVYCTDSITTTVSTGGYQANGPGGIVHVGATGGLFNQLGTHTNLTTTSRLYGTATFIFEGSGTIDTGGTAGAVGVNIVVNTVGTYTLNPITALPGATFTYTSGTIDFSGVDIYVYNTGLILNGISSLIFKKLIVGFSNFTGTYITLNDTLNIDEIDCSPSTNSLMGFNGTNPFICNTLNLPYRAAGGDDFVLQSSLAYTINTFFGNSKFTTFFKANPAKVTSTSPGVKSKINLSPGASQELLFVDFTDIDASGGQTIWTFGLTPTVTNCDNINKFNQPKAVGF